MKPFSPTFLEPLIETTLPCGLKLAIIPKTDFTRTEVQLAIPFGSLSTEVYERDCSEPIRIPEGMAHFLEHLLFESDTMDISKRFAQAGAVVNAYTTYDKTAYYFQTTSDILQPIQLLIEMVLTAQFSLEGMKKEAAIIEQEMMMYDDDYEQQIYQTLLHHLYSSHPIRNDIAGTPDSVKQTTYDELMRAYQLFYHPENMVMVVVGNVDPNQVQSLVETTCQRYITHQNRYYKTKTPADATLTKSYHRTYKKDVAIPMMMMGIRLRLDETKSLWERALDDVKLSFLLSGVFGKGGHVYRDLMKRRVINDAFDYFSSYEDSYGHLILFTETKKPDMTRKILEEAIKAIKTTHPDMKQFELSKRKLVGEYIQMFDQISQLANQLLDYTMKGISLFDFFNALSQITYEDLLAIREDILMDNLVTITYSNES